MKFEILGQEKEETARMLCRVDSEGDFVIEVHHPELYSSNKTVLAYIEKSNGYLHICDQTESESEVLKRIGFSIKDNQIEVR